MPLRAGGNWPYSSRALTRALVGRCPGHESLCMSARQPLEFVDTNVLLYYYDLSAGTKRQRAKELLERLWQSRLGCLSIQVLQEFYVNATRKLANPIGYKVACQVVHDFSLWRVHSPLPVTTQAQIEWAACWLVMMSGHRVDSSYATDCDP